MHRNTVNKHAPSTLRVNSNVREARLIPGDRRCAQNNNGRNQVANSAPAPRRVRRVQNNANNGRQRGVNVPNGEGRNLRTRRRAPPPYGAVHHNGYTAPYRHAPYHPVQRRDRPYLRHAPAGHRYRNNRMYAPPNAVIIQCCQNNGNIHIHHIR
eukprot:112400_1